MTVAVIGASGFIGCRTVESLHLGGLAAVRPVVRTYASLARVSRFDLDWRVADARDRRALAAALAGCDAAVYAVAGDPATILTTSQTAYLAAADAGVRRLVYLSSAAVHGQDPDPGTDEATPLSHRQPLPYNRAKVQAERALRRLRDRGRVELVVLRPGIVFGPRSRWTGGLADALLAGTAYLVEGGRGICNHTYVDNLVHAIWLAATVPAADRQALLVIDRERTTWAEFYAPIAAALGMDLSRVPIVPAPRAPSGWRGAAAVRRSAALARRVLAGVPASWCRAARGAVGSGRGGGGRGGEGAAPPPVSTLEMALLHRCRTKLPSARVSAVLGYAQAVAFDEACRRAIGWLAFAGYPVSKGET